MKISFCENFRFSKVIVYKDPYLIKIACTGPFKKKTYCFLKVVTLKKHTEWHLRRSFFVKIYNLKNRKMFKRRHSLHTFLTRLSAMDEVPTYVTGHY